MICQQCNRPFEAPASRMSGLAVASFVCGLVSVCTFIPAIPGLIMGILSMSRIGNSAGALRGSGLATAGIVLSCLGFVATPMLAAILFPVFSQAREKAMMSGCQSNHNQAIRAIIMYCNDFDDYLPLTTTRGFGPKTDWGIVSEAKTADQPWPKALAPYVKFEHVFTCPHDPNQDHVLDPKGIGQAHATSPETRSECGYYHTNLGFNYAWLSSNAIAGKMPIWTIAQQSGVGNPANTILFADSAYATDADGKPLGGGAFVVDAPVFPEGMKVWRPVGAEPPWDGWHCYSNGHGEMTFAACKDSSAFGKVHAYHLGSQRVVVSFLDGHVRSMAPEELVAGWDWKSNKVLDWEAFMWDTLQ